MAPSDGLALLLGVATVFGVKSFLDSLQATEPVVIAAREIPERAVITSDMVTIVQVNRGERARLAADSFGSKEQVLGRYARRRIDAGEVLRNRPGDLTESPYGVTVRIGMMPLAESLPSDTRAVAVKLDRQAVLGQQVRIGDYVDLIFTSKSDSTGGVYSTMLIQQVRVLNIEQPADSVDGEVLVTFLVNPAQSVDVSLAKRTGTIDLALNPPDPGDPIDPWPSSPLKFTRTPEVHPPLPDGETASAGEDRGVISR